MTVLVALEFSGGVVFAADGRLTGADGGIISDQDQKVHLGRGYLLAVCGSPGGVWTQLRHSRSWAGVSRVIAEDATSDKRDYELLAAHGREVMRINGGGDVIPVKGFATAGAGGDAAFGFLNAHKPPRTEKAARTLARKAIEVACKRSVVCGGDVAVETLRWR